MKITTVITGILEENCYIIESEQAAVIIDPGQFTPELEQLSKELRNKETLILLTHCHFDHILGANKLKEALSCDVAIGAIDAPGLSDLSLNLCGAMRIKSAMIEADRLLNDGDIIACGDISFSVILTPGHTAGSVCYKLLNNLFSGDTLFAGTAGRTDFKSGNHSELMQSLRKLSELDDNTIIYPGHYDSSTIGVERLRNYFMREACIG